MSDDTQVLVKFVTKSSELLQVPDTPVAIPAKLKRYGLSQIVNHLLNLAPPQPFDFLIEKELIRKSVGNHLLAHNISPETVIEIEYVPALVPPKLTTESTLEDWISSLGYSKGQGLLAGCYDGCVHFVNSDDGVQMGSATVHSGPVSDVVCLPSSQGRLCVTTSKDRTAKLWTVSIKGGGSGGEDSPRVASGLSPVAQYIGHADSVEGAAASPSGNRLCTAGWDGQLLIWRTGGEVVEAADASGLAVGPSTNGVEGEGKRRKKAGQVPVHKEEAVGKLEGHLHCVSSVTWPTEEVLFSGGWDHSVRRWDVESGVCTESHHGSKAVLAVACAHVGHVDDHVGVLAFGCSDGALRVWDPRQRKGEALAVRSLPSHLGWVSTLSWSPASAWHLVSGGHDGAVKVWDVRAAVPLATLAAAGAGADKVLAATWLGPAGFVTGGADRVLRLFKLDVAPVH